MPSKSCRDFDHRNRYPVLTWATVLLCASCGSFPSTRAQELADLVLHHGKIATCDAQDRIVQAIAIRGTRIVAVGADTEIACWIGPGTKVIDLAGRLVVPGFIEGHGHLVSLGETKLGLDLSQARNWDEVVQRVARAARNARPGEWLIGRGWHQEKWDRPAQTDGSRYPTHHALTAAAPDNPVLLIHGSGHMCVANERAMREAGVRRETHPPAGGEILRDANGEPTGVFRETAQAQLLAAHGRFLARRPPAQAAAELRASIAAAGRECLRKGVTSFHDAGVSLGTLRMYRKLEEERQLPLRVWVMLRGSPDELEQWLPKERTVAPFGFLTVRGIKCMADGALGSHGAWLLEPYDDLSASTGLTVQSIEEIRRTAILAVKYQYQLCTHAIGDRANREVLNVYQAVLQGADNRRDHRWRIEHVQHLHAEDIPRFGELGVIASMQANHATSDGPFVVTRLGLDRASRSYAWRSLLDAGARIVNGTDAPVEDVDPLRCFHASITRKMADGRTFFPRQAMTRREALRSYTIDAAYAAFEEQAKGSLEAGKLADLVVLSTDILTAPEDQVAAAKVELTVLDGAVVWQRE